MNTINSDSKEEEVWKVISGYEGLYDVSNLGGVRSYHINGRHRQSNPIAVNGKPRIMKRTVNTNGQLKVRLSKNSSTVLKSIVRLVADTFLKPPKKESWVISYRDGNRLNATAENLWYCSRSVASRHARKKTVRGSRYGGCLNRDIANRIREKYATGEGIDGDKRKRSVTLEALAIEYGVTLPAISQIINRVTYK